jgi:hypothetical protein
METDDVAIQSRLDELEALDTVSAFCQSFYRLTYRLVTIASDQEGVRIALTGLLDVELRYHRELDCLTERDQASVADLRSAGERHRIGLNAVRQYTLRLERLETLAQAARDLVLAECCYHLRRTAEVVAALERVVKLGVDQPLVHFALGYNRYLLALETCTDAIGPEGVHEVHDAASLRLQCLRAASALEDGLQGSELDGQLYWWIGVVLDAGGLTEAAQDAYDRSAELLHPDSSDDEREPGEATEWRQQSPAPRDITDDDIRRAAHALSQAFDPAWLYRSEQDER